MNNELEIKPRDWFAVGQTFGGPYYYDDPKSGTVSAQLHGVNIGVQALSAMDAASLYGLHSRPVEKMPSPFTASEIVSFLKEVFERHGKPRIGVLLSRSVWLSSTEMLLDEQVSDRAQILTKWGIDFGPMETKEKEKVVAWLDKVGLRAEFDEENLIL